MRHGGQLGVISVSEMAPSGLAEGSRGSSRGAFNALPFLPGRFLTPDDFTRQRDTPGAAKG